MNDEKVIDLRGKSADEIVDAYAGIARDVKEAELIWQETGNIEAATELYEKYQEKKDKTKINIKVD